MLETNYEHSWAKISDDKIGEGSEVKLLGVTIDDKFKFDSHIPTNCFKANQKLCVLNRFGNILTFDRKRMLFKTFLNLNLSVALRFGCFVAEGPIIELIYCMNEPSDLYTMITKHRYRTYSQYVKGDRELFFQANLCQVG